MSDMMTFPDTWEEFEKSYGFTDNKEVYTNGARLIPSFRVKQWLDYLPSAGKPFKLPEIYVADGFDTVEDEDGNIGFGVYAPAENQIYVVGDVEDEIRARALLHEVCHWVQAMCGRPFDEDEANEFSDIVYDALPSVQPRKGKWIGYKADDKDWQRDDGSPIFMNCSECHEAVINNGSAHWNFCPNCGVDMRGEQDD